MRQRHLQGQGGWGCGVERGEKEEEALRESSLNSAAPRQKGLTERLVWVELGLSAEVATYLGVNLGFTFY